MFGMLLKYWLSNEGGFVGGEKVDQAGVLVSGGLLCLLVCVAVSGSDMTCCSVEVVLCEACCCDVCWMSCCVGCAVKFGQFVDDDDAVAWSAAAVVLADVFGLAVDAAAVVSDDVFGLVVDAAVLAAVTVENAVLADVVELPAASLAADVLTSLAYGAVTACFAAEPGCGSVLSWSMSLSKCLLKVLL